MSKSSEYISNSPPWYNKVLRLPEVVKRTGLSKSSVYKLIKEGKFPKQMEISQRCRGWDEDEIQDWILARLSKKKPFDPAVGDKIPF
ncbi:MAG: helix-turn-helix transcriptional regulator [Rickettsiales bacterium]